MNNHRRFYTVNKSKPRNKTADLDDSSSEENNDGTLDDDILMSNMMGLNIDGRTGSSTTVHSNRLDQLLNYAHPLIVLDAELLESSFLQLKEIIGQAAESQMNDEQLVKILIKNDCDLNRVVPIVLNFE